jgi:AMMECR1
MRFPFRALVRPLDARVRSRVEAQMRVLLAWQRSLRRWPGVARGLPDATPFVSVYAAGRLLGCFGCDEGDASERLSRAFLLALHDPRFGSVSDARDSLAVEVAYPVAPKRVPLSRAKAVLEPGHHGLACARANGPPVLLLPSVARHGGLDADAMLELLAKKLGIAKSALANGALYVCETDSAVARSAIRGADRRELGAEEAAARWLAARVDRDGNVEFGFDPLGRGHDARGLFHQGRAAVLIRALDEHGGHSATVARARRRLVREIERGLAGRGVRGFPEHPAEIAGTLALASLAGVDVRRPLERFAKRSALRAVPWHAAQVVYALGRAAPPELWSACVSDLAARPWAPWTALAARSVGDARTLQRAERALIESIRPTAPFSGGANVRPIPELALTAVVVEALEESRSASARRARAKAVEFLKTWQVRHQPISAAFEPASATGGFPLSPVIPYLRSDVTAHALRALAAARR